MQSDLSILYEPYELEGLELKNRLVMAPMHTKPSGRAAGLIVLENTCIDWVYGRTPLAPSMVKSKIGGDEPRALEDQEIEAIIQRYVDAARRTKDAGFDGVDLVALGRSLRGRR